MRAKADILQMAASDSGADSWAEFVASFRRTAADQMDMLPVVGFVILVFVIGVLNWKVAKRLSRPAGGRRSTPAAGDRDEHQRAA